MRVRPLLFLIGLVVLRLPVPVAAELIVQSFDPNRHNRFNNSSLFTGNPYDWSGVGRSNVGTWGTLISPSYVVSATHFPVNGTLRFYQTNDPNGPFVERTILSGGAIASSDLYLARLSSPITSGINYFPIVGPAAADAFLEQTIYTFGQSNSGIPQTNVRLGRNTIDEVVSDFSHPNLGASHGDVFTFDFDNPGGVGADESRVQGGDSGAPSFLIVNGAPALVGVHWFMYDVPETGEVGSGDTLISSFVTSLNFAMMGESAVIVAIPEPSTLMLSGLVILATVIRRRRNGHVPQSTLRIWHAPPCGL